MNEQAQEPAAEAAPVAQAAAASAAPRVVRRRRVPGGRPHLVGVKLTDEELATVRERATAVGLTPSTYLAQPLSAPVDGSGVLHGLGREQRRAWMVEMMALRRLLQAAGNNLNQIAKVANATGEVPADVTAATAQLQRVLERLDTAIAVGEGRPRR